MATTRWLWIATALGAGAGALLAALTGTALWLFALALTGFLLGLGLGWSRERAALRAAFESPAGWEWCETGAFEPDTPADAELRGLGYRPCGVLRRAEGAGRASPRDLRVYLHPELPIYAFVRLAKEPGGRLVAACRLETFFEGGGWLVTASEWAPDLFAAAVPGEAPRLAQFRRRGTPIALDGQHVGTVRAWIAGGRHARPASCAALPAELAAERETARRLLAAGGWLSPLEYLWAALGRPRRLLKF